MHILFVIQSFIVTSLSFFLYTGPESILPIASTLAAIIGMALVMWNRLLGFLARLMAFFRRKVAQSTQRQ
jgi:hypothetical protein